MTNTIRVDIVSAEAEIFSGDATMVIATGELEDDEDGIVFAGGGLDGGIGRHGIEGEEGLLEEDAVGGIDDALFRVAWRAGHVYPQVSLQGGADGG